MAASTREAVAPQRMVANFAFLMVMVALLMVTLMAAYFFLHRKQEMTEIEPPENSHHENHDSNHVNGALVR